MSNILYDLIEINIVASVAICLLCMSAGYIRKRCGAFCLKMIWLFLAARLLIPYNFSLPDTSLRLFNAPGFEQGQMMGAFMGDLQTLFSADAPYGKGMIPPGDVGLMDREDENTSGMEKMKSASEASTVADPAAANTGGEPKKPVSDTERYAAGQDFSVRSEFMDPRKILGETAKTNPYFYSDIMLVVWVAGILIFATYYVLIYAVWTRQCRSSLRKIKDRELQISIAELQRKYAGKKILPVYESYMASSPMLVGTMRPKLIVPTGWEKWKREELKLVITHELCHYFQKDLWLKAVVLASCCINWFNPFLYVMKKQFFYDAELVCDHMAVRSADSDGRELYAETLLGFAGKHKKNPIFISEFSSDKKQLKDRVSYLFEKPGKKGPVLFAVVTVLFLAAGVFISCGYKPEENVLHAQITRKPAGEAAEVTSNEGTGVDGTFAEGTSISEESMAGISGGAAENGAENGGQADNGSELAVHGFNYNHEYNKRVRYFDGITYISEPDGIYRVVDGEEELICANAYSENRGMAIHNGFLYFCGDAGRETVDRADATVYKMNLETLETSDVLAGISEEYEWLICPEIEDNKLYVSRPFDKIGFLLNENGDAVEIMDASAPDFLYHDYNEYYSLYYDLYDGSPDYESAAWQERAARMNEIYVPLINITECKRMLNGAYVVYRYKDEAMVSIYLANADGTYTRLCDAAYFGPMLVTDTGVYYSDLNEDILFTDYATVSTRRILEKEKQPEKGMQLLNYDEEFLYYIPGAFRRLVNEKDEVYFENNILRFPRTGGGTEELYRIEGTEKGWISCGLSPDYMIYFEDYADGQRATNIQPKEQQGAKETSDEA